MSLRSITETIGDLRIILEEFEHSPEADYDEFAQAELKRIILGRITELEAEQAMNQKAMPAPISSVEPPKDTN